MTPESFFGSDHCLAINKARQDHFLSLNLPLKGKRVLEPGAGIGHNTKFLLDQGAYVTALEPRQENYDAFLIKAHPRLQVIKNHVDSIAHMNVKYDVVFCYGLLYHVGTPAAVLKELGKACSGYLALETVVSPSPQVWSFEHAEASDEPGNSIYGMGSRPTRSYLKEAMYQAGFDYTYFPKTQPKHVDFPLDWTGEMFEEDKLQRATVIASRTEIVNPLLLTYIPQLQSWPR